MNTIYTIAVAVGGTKNRKADEMTRPDMLPTSGNKTLDAEIRCSQWLAAANELAERGKRVQAETYYDKAQFWLDRYNRLAGNS